MEIFIASVCGLIFLIATMGLEPKQGSPLYGMLAVLCVFVSTYFMFDDFYKKEQVKEGRAEWVQVVQEDGSVENEFKWKEFND